MITSCEGAAGELCSISFASILGFSSLHLAHNLLPRFLLPSYQTFRTSRLATAQPLTSKLKVLHFLEEIIKTSSSTRNINISRILNSTSMTEG